MDDPGLLDAAGWKGYAKAAECAALQTLRGSGCVSENAKRLAESKWPIADGRWQTAEASKMKSGRGLPQSKTLSRSSIPRELKKKMKKIVD
jgi:hypothetical protein